MAIIKLSEGQYAIRWRDSRGKRHYETLPEKTPYKQVVKIHAAKVADRGEKTEPNTATVARICRDYLELHDVHATRPFTELGRARAEGIVRQIEQDPLGAILVGESKPKHFLQWRLRRKASVSDATLDREWNFVRAALNLATTTEEIVTNPVKRGAIKRLVSSTEGKIVYFEPAEWRAFISALDNEDQWRAHVRSTQRKGVVKIGSVVDTPRSYGAGRNAESDATREYRHRLLRLRPYFAALLWTGSRLSEIRLLTWADVDFRGGVVHVPQGKAGGKRKTVPMADELRADLEALPRGIGRALVFTRTDGKEYGKMEIERAFNVYRTVAGLRRELTIHSTRHTAASWMIIAGRPIKEVQEILGHASLAMTLKYIHLAPTHLRGAVDALAAMRDSVTEDLPKVRLPNESDPPPP